MKHGARWLREIPTRNTPHGIGLTGLLDSYPDSDYRKQIERELARRNKRNEKRRKANRV